MISIDLFAFFHTVHPVWPAPFVEDAIFFQCLFLASLSKTQAFIVVWVCLHLQFYSINQCVYFCANTMLFYYYSSAIQFEVEESTTSRSSFIIQDCFSLPQFLFFHMELRIVLSRFVKNCVGILMGIALICELRLVGWVFYYINSINS